jgi:diaminopimelate epimerase
MRFTKMHGIGNDYVYVDCFDESVPDPAATARAVSDRHFGIGGDGLILIMPSEIADVRMRMFNADGSEGQMCGNGVRCVAKYAFDHGRTSANPMRVETGAGIKTIDLVLDDAGKAVAATVDMGEPILAPGNPHAVIYVDAVAAVALSEIGPALENHELFPERMNVHFVQVVSEAEVTMVTWERGSGPTLACGTGASAVCVAGVLTGKTGRTLLAHLPGGDLELAWQESDNHVFMTGPAAEVFSGEWAN